MSYHFHGFANPHYTQIPDEAFDELMPILSPAQWKVLCYIMRRTFGFQKTSDDISLRQLVDGITTLDGRKLDSGTGLSKAGVVKALAELEEMQIIRSHRNRSYERGNEPTTYTLRFADPLSTE